MSKHTQPRKNKPFSAKASIPAAPQPSPQGPLPQPGELERYEAIAPGAANRILAMAESQQKHRQALENLTVQANLSAQQRQLSLAERQTQAVTRSDLLGQIAGFLVGLACVSGSVYLAAWADEPWVAGVLGALPLAGLLRAFKEGTR